MHAQSLNEAVRSVDEDLAAALKELATMREEIANERNPLVRELEALETEVNNKSSELARQQNIRDNRQIGIQALQKEVDSKQSEIEYIGGLLRDFVRSFNAQINVSEKQLYGEQISNTENASLAGNTSQKELFDLQMEVVETSLDRLSKAIGGYTYDGKAMVNGVKVPGRFAYLGPTVYFRSDDRVAAGFASAGDAATGESENATIVSSKTFDVTAISDMIDNQSGTLPLDATLGGAIQVERTDETTWEHIQKGGFVGMMIIALGGVTLLIGIFKVVSISSFRVPSGTFVLDLAEMVKRGDRDGAISKAKSFGGLPGDMFQEAIENCDQPRNLIEEYLSVKIIIARRKLESLLPFVAIIAAAAPLMGLLGTVVGMIKTFKLITVFGTGDARSLSSGISEALVTTELGLFVAIPSLIVHGILNRMARTKWGQLEQDSIVFLNDVTED